MEMAHRLLQSGKYKVKDVVWMVGYTNASHFIDAFKKDMALRPEKFKFLLRGKTLENRHLPIFRIMLN